MVTGRRPIREPWSTGARVRLRNRFGVSWASAFQIENETKTDDSGRRCYVVRPISDDSIEADTFSDEDMWSEPEPWWMS
jgi:hypothetical protein